jgi:hypothetical protein
METDLADPGRLKLNQATRRLRNWRPRQPEEMMKRLKPERLNI